MTPQEPLTRAQRALLVIVTLLVAPTRLVPLEKFPWDWDEILFCMALHDYNMAAHQPHPPGFPLYVALCRLARLFTETDFGALQVVNVGAAIFYVPVAFWVARAFRFSFAMSIWSALLFAFLPNIWFFGGCGFSDTLGLVLFLAALAAFIRSRDDVSPRLYAVGSAMLALALTVRPQVALIIVFPWTIATFTLARSKRWKTVVVCAVAVTLFVTVVYGIAAYVTGVNDFVASLRAHGNYVKRADSADNPLRPPLLEVLRLQLDPYLAGKVSLLVNLISLVALIGGRRKMAAEVLLSFGPYFVFTTIALNALGFSRLGLPWMMGTVLLTAEGTDVLAGAVRRLAPRLEPPFRLAVLAVLMGRFITWVLPAFELPGNGPAPPTAAALYLRDHTDPKKTVIYMHESMWPWSKYYLKDFKLVHVYDDYAIDSENDVRDDWFIGAGGTQSLQTKMFTWPRGSRTWNIVSRRYFEAFVQPASDVVKFGRGWHDLEFIDMEMWRWSKGRAAMQFPPLGGTCELRMQFLVPLDTIGRPSSRVFFTMNGQRLPPFTATQKENEVRFVVRAHGHAPNVLEIQAEHPVVPAAMGGGDRRELGVMLRAWKWTRIAD